MFCQERQQQFLVPIQVGQRFKVGDHCFQYLDRAPHAHVLVHLLDDALAPCPPEFSLYSGAREILRNDLTAVYGWTLDHGRDYVLRCLRFQRPLLTLRYCDISLEQGQ